MVKLGRTRHLLAVISDCIDYLACLLLLAIVNKNPHTHSYKISLMLFSRENSPWKPTSALLTFPNLSM